MMLHAYLCCGLLSWVPSVDYIPMVVSDIHDAHRREAMFAQFAWAKVCARFLHPALSLAAVIKLEKQRILLTNFKSTQNPTIIQLI